jgi:CTP synthase (UTP-ammonia lyase)
VLDAPTRPLAIIVGDRDPAKPAHVAVDRARDRLSIYLAARWVGSADFAVDPAENLEFADGIWVAPGSPYRSMEGALQAVRGARERRIPLFGT